MASLRIVWRNPRRRKTPRKWRIAKGLYQGAYVVEELVSAATDSWQCTLVLAVVGSAQPDAQRVPPAPGRRNCAGMKTS